MAQNPDTRSMRLRSSSVLNVADHPSQARRQIGQSQTRCACLVSHRGAWHALLMPLSHVRRIMSRKVSRAAGPFLCPGGSDAASKSFGQHLRLNKTLPDAGAFPILSASKIRPGVRGTSVTFDTETI